MFYHNIMNIIFIFIAMGAIFLELNKEINTVNIVKKLCLLAVVIGCCLNFDGKLYVNDFGQNMIILGSMIFIFMCNLPKK